MPKHGRKRRATTDFTVEHWCSPDEFTTFYKQEVKPKLTTLVDHKKQLDNWPFRHFLSLPDIIGTKHFLLDLFSRWDSRQGAFNFDGMLLHPTADEFAIILGLRARGRPMTERPLKSNNKKIQSDTWRRFIPEGPLNRGTLQSLLIRELGENCTATLEEWVSMFTMLLFSYVLFTRTNANVPMHLWEFVDNLEGLWNYGWGQAVHRDTCSQFEAIAKAVKGYYEGSGKKQVVMQGCIFVLMVCFQYTQTT
jgi:hypothetical protein